jgi:uncharacterized protein YjiK
MYKRILIAVTVLSFSQVALAEKSEIFKCVDKATLIAEQNCVANTIEKNSNSSDFYAQLAEQEFSPSRDAMASITHFPKKNLIAVKSLEAKSEAILLANR